MQLPSVGLLALQGSVEPHHVAMKRLGVDSLPVRRPEQLEGLTHLILPGGESTALYKLLADYGLWEPIRKRGGDGSLAIFGTCAGAILLGQENGECPPRLGLLDAAVERNAYGRQLESFVATLRLREPLGELQGIFIRAPRCRQPGAGVEVLGSLNGEPVVLRQGRLLVATFHPEPTRSLALHRYFLSF
ncbi:MAG: pyridoxal 5'-phosphate synthase glutaminase subunit PdxT [Planctomycetota bacterium]